MDVIYTYRDGSFIWNAEKASANRVKHGISFERACEVFFDPLLRFLDATNGEEQREAAIGKSQDGTVLFVVHILRTSEYVRIISARPLRGKEKRKYEDYE